MSIPMTKVIAIPMISKVMAIPIISKVMAVPMTKVSLIMLNLYHFIGTVAAVVRRTKRVPRMTLFVI